MLDQMSGGRLEIGFGRGSVPIEIEYYGADPADAQEVYAEAVEIVLKGLTQKVLDHRRQALYRQQRADGDRAAAEAASADLVRRAHAGQRRARGAPQAQRRQPRPAGRDAAVDRPLPRDLAAGARAAGTPLPKLGLGRFVVVAPTDAEALALARRAYPVWHASFTYLFRRHGRSQSHPRPATFDLVMERGQGIAGSPQTVAEVLGAQLAETGCNYMVGQFTFGDLTLAECLRSIGLFAERGDAGAAGGATQEAKASPLDPRRDAPLKWPALRCTATRD